MRTYLVLIAVILAAVAAFGQQSVPPRIYGRCFYGCGPSIPMVTTPEVSLETFSPNPVGASNATTGLIAGATNSTLSEMQGSTSSVYTVAVWYQGGGAPLITPDVRLWPETIGREGRPMREALREPRPQEQRAGESRARESRSREPRGPSELNEPRGDWTYITGQAQAASGFKKATRTYTNDDVARQNDTNGTVKHAGKTEKM